MNRVLKIERAIYFVDGISRTYQFLRRNPDWRELNPVENEINKLHIDGFWRIFRNGKIRKYIRSEHP